MRHGEESLPKREKRGPKGASQLLRLHEEEFFQPCFRLIPVGRETSNSGLKVLTFPRKIPCCDGTVSKNDMIHEQVGVDLFIIFLAGS